MKVHSFFKVHKILTELGTNSKLICFMQVILLVVGHKVIREDEGKHGGGVMWLTVPSRKKDDSGKSGRKMEIKKYLQTERKAKSAVHAATKSVQEAKFGDAKSNDQRNQVFKEAYRMKSKNQDIVGYKYINYDDDNLVFDDKSKSAAWKSHYENLLNVEFSWDSSTLSEEQLFQVPPITITTKMVSKALTKTKKGKAAGSSGLKVEMMLAGGNDIILITTCLVNCIVAEGKIPNNRNLSYIINCYKDKGDALLRCNCRGLKLLEQVMKVTGHILATIIRTQVDIDAMQFGSMSRRKTSDGIFILQEVHEEYLG